jgi:predicted nucleic acid-binding protein
MRLLRAEIDPGESAAIALARRINSDLLIVDDMAGRRLAQRMGLTVTGTVGVVLAGAERHLIDDPFVVLDDLRKRGGLWLSDSFVENLRSAWQPTV